MESVAVYSHIDRDAPFVKLADYAYCIGESEPLKSYLDMDKVISTARQAGAEAIHPGYGFLAENPDFAAACRENDIVFIGPNPEVISLMGDKLAARKLAEQFDVPVIPGMQEPSESPDMLRQWAEKIGYPLLIKAAYGGGGKGMRTVGSAAELEQSLKSAMNEAHGAFGNSTVYLEKLVQAPRHIEIQVVCDHHGHGVYLPERECSIQRRHQKLVEESPSTAVDEGLRKKIGEAAVKLALEAGYDSVGTVEFLMDKNRNFYFLEMNTRLQVEHPVTEMITGLDLLKLQVELASGCRLSLKQSDISFTGAAIECRICAEDPFNNFLPDSGTIQYLFEPSGPGVRMDSGVETASRVARFYDSLIAKLVCWGENRDEAINRCSRALTEYTVSGVKTTIPFHRLVLKSDAFRAGDTTTDFIGRHLPGLIDEEAVKEEETAAVVAAVLSFLEKKKKVFQSKTGPGRKQNMWKYTYRESK